MADIKKSQADGGGVAGRRESLAESLAAGATVLSSWITLPEPLVLETTLRAGFDAATMDMQHGLHGIDAVLRGIGAAALVGKPSVVRIPVGDFSMAARLLDMGAHAVIAPMINTADDARRFVEATKYPPVGERSFGPLRAMALFGDETPAAYLARANVTTMSIAMIETMQAVAALDDILAVPGIDAVFVGPADLSLSRFAGEKIAPADPEIVGLMRMIAARAMAAGKIATTVADGPERIGLVREMGYRFIGVGTDVGYIARGVKGLIDGVIR